MRKTSPIQRLRADRTTISRRSFIAGGLSIPAVLLVGHSPSIFAQTAAFDYYIGPSGLNSNAGTASSPWALSSLQAKGSLIAGKRIGLLPGTYVAPSGANENDYLRPVVNVVGGTSSSHTIVESVSPQQAVITSWNGSNYSSYVPAPIGTLNQHVTFRGLKITRVVHKALMIGSSNVLVENCEIYDIDQRRDPAYSVADNTEGIRIEDYAGGNAPSLSGIIVRNCKIHDVYNDTSAGSFVRNSEYNASCIKIYRTRGLVVENCTMFNANEGVFAKSYTEGTVVRYCHLYDISSATRRLGGNGSSSGLSAYVHNNFFYNVEQYYDAEVDQATTHNLHIYNNTAYVNRSLPSAGGFYLRSNAPRLVRLYNNIVYADSGSSTEYLGIGVTDKNTNPGQFAVLDYNCYAGKVANWANSMFTSLPAWRTAMANAVGGELNSLSADPLFRTRGSNLPANYRLNSGSPCASAGRVGGASQNSAVDMGCWSPGVLQVGCDLLTSIVRPNAPVIQAVS